MTESRTIQQLTSYKVLLIGDSCIDQYMIGTIDRLSPEAPVPVIKNVETTTVLGMASNVNANLKNLNIDTYFIHNSEEIIKTRYIDKKSGQQLLRVDSEPTIAPWSGELSDQDFDAIVISDYDKGFLTYDLIQQLIRSTDKPIFIDTKKTNLRKFSGDHVYVKINESEYKNSISVPTNLIVTLGERGAMHKKSFLTSTYSTNSVEVTDVCGAGDTFLAALCAQYLSTKDIEQAIIFANIAAGITVQHRGNYAPSYDEIRIAGY